jgi:polyisoprenoid-binding protein YceI
MAGDEWTIDSGRSEVRFSLRHLVFAKVEGTLEILSGHVRYDAAQPSESTVAVTLGSASVTTGDPERDSHIRSPEFLDATRFPEIRFQSRGLSPIGHGRFEVVGDLRIRDRTREVILRAHEEVGPTGPPRSTGSSGASFVAATTINRQDFGLHWNQDLDTGGIVLGDKVEVTIKVVVVARSSPQL